VPWGGAVVRNGAFAPHESIIIGTRASLCYYSSCPNVRVIFCPATSSYMLVGRIAPDSLTELAEERSWFMNSDRSRKTLTPLLIAYSPLFVAFLFILPRLLAARFGLLDDAVLIAVSREVVHHPSASLHAFASAGRFLPSYWLYYAFWYSLGGSSALLWYIGEALLFVCTVAMIIALMRTAGAGPFECWMASLLFIFSAPAAEAYFTLSKGESFMLLTLLGSLLLVHKSSRAKHPNWYLIAAAWLVLISVTTRETAIAALGAALAWIALSYWKGVEASFILPRRYLIAYTLLLGIGLIVLVAARAMLRLAVPAGSYAGGYHFTWANISQSISSWSFSLTRDFPVTCLFLVCALALWRGGKLKHAGVLLMMVAWMAAWIVILLPWRDFHPYYLLPFCAGSSIFCGFMAGNVLGIARTGSRPARLTLVLGAILLGILIVNNINYARYQIMVDLANSEMVDYVKRLPHSSTVLLNYPFSHEYAFEFQLHLADLAGRPDIRVAPLNFAPTDWRTGQHRYYVISLRITNELWPLVRGTMLETAVAQWNGSWEGFAGWQARPEAVITDSMQMADFELQAIWCGVVDRLRPMVASVPCHSISRPVIDLRDATYGWAIYSYPRWKETPAQPAVFLADGTWLFEQSDGTITHESFGAAGDEPVPADWEGGGSLEMAVYRPSTNRWYIASAADEGPERSFQLPTMSSDDLPVAGDWDGDGKAAPGYYRMKDATWHLFRKSGEAVIVHFGDGKSRPLVGDWDHDGYATPGLYNENGTVTVINDLRDDAVRVEFKLPPGGTPFVTNWSGVGVDTVNTVVGQKWVRRFANCNCEPSNASNEFSSKLPLGQTFVGRWKLAQKR
jgi:hypothetical protein